MDNSLEATNAKIESLLNQIEQISAENEDSDKLVLLLLDSIRERQISIDSMINDAVDDTFAPSLSKQLKLTENFSRRAAKIMSHRQNLLNLKRTHQRQVKVYQNIDANR
ncbi:hypothetical protein [Shewanella phaeophyticola]|uniref:Flagella biosynthesis chaperone for FliD, FliT n=1 Tax=Shewanella phaeophyticola TaxID=2978345 RepID=A0ABT2P5Q8_9GAMM|nr:hypothetical protein [Shewanella sp. KJ10-1]MCT8987229.1 hypothetical protein [Shewanella sp. KJ10-1]MCU7372957.1 hypothetical protein [Paucibacter sp. O1-1]MDA3827953.1 hypothetical protein [Paucibacter sp. O1-1]